MIDTCAVANYSFWVALDGMYGIGPVRAQQLRSHISVDELFVADAHHLAQFGLKSNHYQWLHSDAFQRRLQWVMDWQSKPEHWLLTPDHLSYPSLVKEISAAPMLLFGQGDHLLLQTPQLALVGSRTPTPYGKAMAHQFAAELAALGYTITSGLARGIDGAAHQGALSVQGRTVAVLGSGLERVYPKRHIALARDVVEQGGALVSELWPEEMALAEHFPRRNRIISGLSLGTLVVEASLRSGSLITARYALEQNREVFAIPGALINPQADGSNWLIQNNAKLVRNVADIVEEVAALTTSIVLHYASTHPLSEAVVEQSSYPKLLECVDYQCTSVDTLAERSQLPVEQVVSALTELEIEGWIQAVAGGYTRIRRR